MPQLAAAPAKPNKSSRDGALLTLNTMFDALLADAVVSTEYGFTARCGSIIYRIESAHRDSDRLSAQSDIETALSLEIVPVLVMTEVTDETIVLVGFSSAERRRLYQALRAVTGIGRRSALLVLDCGEVIDTLRAVASKDSSYFRGVPGLGTARITKLFAELEKRYKGVLPEALPLPVLWWVEARDALVHSNLDLTQAERLLRTALSAAPSPPRSAEELYGLAAADLPTP